MNIDLGVWFKKMKKSQLLLPIVAMILVMAVNIIHDAATGAGAFSFFKITLQQTTGNGTILYGRIIDILNRATSAEWESIAVKYPQFESFL